MTNKTKLSGYIIMMAVIWCLAYSLFHPDIVCDALKQAVIRCLDILVPSLFAFMAFSELLIQSGSYIILSKIFFPVSIVTGLPDELAAVFIISNIAGYPVGASMISSLYDNGRISKEDASRLICFCCNGGPAFFGGAVGLAVFSSAETGMLLFVSSAIVNLAGACLYFRLFPIGSAANKNQISFKSDMLSAAVCRAGGNLLKICGMVLLFSGISAASAPLLRAIASDDNVRTVIYSFLEISNLSAINGKPYFLLPFMASAGAFGGLCVICQIASVIGNRFDIRRFVASRTVCAVLSFFVFKELWTIFGESYISVSAENTVIVNMNNFIPSICLIMMIFLTFSRKNLQSFSQI